MEVPAISRGKAEWFRRHPKVAARLTTEEKQRLDSLLRSRGQSLTEWVRAMIAECAAERLPESQGDVKKIIPIPAADLAQKVLECEGDRLLRAANKITDPVLRSERRKEAAKYQDAADWFAHVLDQARHRRHVLESGQRKPRHRYTTDRPTSEGAEEEDQS